MSVSEQEKLAMSRLLNIMNGDTSQPIVESKFATDNIAMPVELAGPGQLTQADITAMASVLSKLNQISDNTVSTMIQESHSDPVLTEALNTKKVHNGVKVGQYKIQIKEDSKRIAGKQYYGIYHTATKHVIADDITLYETALAVIRLLNSGKYVNHPDIRTLFEHDETYTAHKIDALRYKKLLNSTNDEFKKDLYESRYQASYQRCVHAKKNIKKITG